MANLVFMRSKRKSEFYFIGVVLFFAVARLVAYSAQIILDFPMHSTLTNFPLLSACFVFTLRLALASMAVLGVITALACPLSARVCRHLTV